MRSMVACLSIIHQRGNADDVGSFIRRDIYSENGLANEDSAFGGDEKGLG